MHALEQRARGKIHIIYQQLASNMLQADKILKFMYHVMEMQCNFTSFLQL